MKKKLVITLLLAALATTSLAGCGKKETANVPAEGTEVVAEVNTETEVEEVVVAETETEEDTESAELVYNTEIENVAKEDKTTEKTDAKKDTTGTGSTKTDSSKGSNSTGTSTGETSQSVGSSQSANSGSTSETKPSTQTATTGTSSTQSSTQNTTPSSSNTQSSTQTTTPSTSETKPSEPETPSEPVVEETQEERIMNTLSANGCIVDQSICDMVKYVMSTYGCSEDEAIAIYLDYHDKLYAGYYSYDCFDLGTDPNTLDWSSYNMCNGYFNGKGHLVCENNGRNWYDVWVKE